MGKILCATRGGEQSYRTQDAAIDLALERGDELVFIYVVNVDFLRKTRRAVRPDVVTAEMARMGSFLLGIAQERAVKQGVAAEVVLRHGRLRDQLMDAVRDEQANVVVLGKPLSTTGVFALRGLQALAAELEAETGIEVFIL
jgi:hypothetical protein